MYTDFSGGEGGLAQADVHESISYINNYMHALMPIIYSRDSHKEIIYACTCKYTFMKGYILNINRYVVR